MPKTPCNKLGADQEAVHAKDAINLILLLGVYFFIYFKQKVAPFNYFLFSHLRCFHMQASCVV